MVLAERTDGRWASPEVGFLVARQNGKGGALEAVVLHGMFLAADPLTLWTAHQFKTTVEAFIRIRGWIDGSDDLRRKVKSISTATGNEGIELRNGVRLRFVARSKSSGRGFSPQRIVFDEAQELSTLAVEAMLPSMSAQPNWQAIYTGTVPGPENNAEHWTRVRDRGRSGDSGRLSWMEWTPAGSDDPKRAAVLDLDDRKLWQSANPALGYRVSTDGIAAERESLSAESFAQERLSVWPSIPDGSGVIDMAAWSACGSDPEPITSPVVLAVETVMDRSSSSIVAVGSREDGSPQAEVAANSGGTNWVPARVVEIAQRNPDVQAVVIDGRSASASLVPAIQRAIEAAKLSSVELVVTSSSDMAEACGQAYDAIVAGDVRHLRDPLLDAAVRGAARRPLGDGAWAWSRKNGGAVISPLVGMTLALWKWRRLTGDDYDVLDSIL